MIFNTVLKHAEVYSIINMRNLQTLLLIIALALTVSCQLHVDPITTHLTDASGRFRFYHGVNTIFK